MATEEEPRMNCCQRCCQRMGQMLSGMWGEPERENPAPPVEASPARTPDTTRKPDPLIRRPIPEGSMVYMQKQDPSVKSIGYRTVWVSTRMWSGPRSDRIEIKGMDRVFPSDSSNNYLYSPYSKPEEFDAVNAFAVINHVHQMYERALKRMDHTRELRWNWGAGPIKVFPRAGDWANAFYSRDEKALAFFHFKDKNGRSDDIIYTGRSFDIMSHEAGHAILDSLKPHYITSKNPQCGALHESFGDLTAIFALLESLDMCEAIIAYSKCDLHSTGWFATIGEEFGTGLGLPMGLRNSDNNLKIDQVTEEVHDLSRVFTGAVFDSLVDIFEVTRNIEKYDPAETLYRVGKHVSAITLIGFLKGPDTNADFRDIAESMMAVETEPVYKEIMKKQFNRRKIFDWSASPRPFNAAAAAPIHTLCGTMQLHNEPQPADSTDSPIRNDMRVRLSTYLNASEASHPPPLPDDTRDATDGPRRPTDIIPLVPTDQPMPDVPNGGEEQHPI